MELPPDDGGLDLGDAPPLPDDVPDEGQVPDDDILGDVFGEVQQYTVLDRNTDLRQTVAHIHRCMVALLNALPWCVQIHN